MASKAKLDMAYMKCAFAISELSHAQRKKVGAVIVSPKGQILAEGCNGTPSGFDNSCERTEVVGKHRISNDPNGMEKCAVCNKIWIGGSQKDELCEKLVTKEEVIHAESNAILKMARSHNSSEGATIYCTLTPCFECAKLIVQAGIKRVVYGEQYPYPGHTGKVRNLGMELLEQANIQIDFLPFEGENPNKELSNGQDRNERWIDPFET